MIKLNPTKTRYVEIHHSKWNAAWALQFPESIAFNDGWIMDFPTIYPNWIQKSKDSFYYEWQSDKSYVQAQDVRQNELMIPVSEKKDFISGVRLMATIAVKDGDIVLTLELFNNSPQTLNKVVCDGGCLQAKSRQFSTEGEIERTYLNVSGQLKPLSELPRTNPVRCMYHMNLSEYDLQPYKEGEWFWGRSSTSATSPVIMTMASHDRQHAVAIGYEAALSGSANADEHHCIHSRPYFGDIRPGENVARKGIIAFESSVQAAYNKVHHYIQGQPSQ